MNIDDIKQIKGCNATEAWINLIKHASSTNWKQCSPLIVSILNDKKCSEPDDIKSRKKLNEIIKEYNEDIGTKETKICNVSSTASTIFPWALWLTCNGERKELYRQYHLRFNGIQKRDPRNAKGTYFQRMILFPTINEKNTCNQLEHIIHMFEFRADSNRSPRRSGLQIAIFNPLKDHTNAAQLGFPCLQQLGITYNIDKSFTLNAHYPIQNIFSRAYGNYLGLLHLGRFLASQINRDFKQLNINISTLNLDTTKKHLTEVIQRLES